MAPVPAAPEPVPAAPDDAMTHIEKSNLQSDVQLRNPVEPGRMVAQVACIGTLRSQTSGGCTMSSPQRGTAGVFAAVMGEALVMGFWMVDVGGAPPPPTVAGGVAPPPH